MRSRRITARRSPVHGKRLFALQPIAAGERVIEYKGELTSWPRAAARQRSELGQTFVFGPSVDGVIANDIRTQYTCQCRASGCRRTMLGSNAGLA
jgi:hypothetical protein